MEKVIGRKVNQAAIDSLLDDINTLEDSQGTLYIGYPGYTIGDEKRIVPATLVSPKFGFIIFDIPEAGSDNTSEHLEHRRDEIFSAIKTKLMAHHDLISRRDLGFKLNILTYFSTIPRHLEGNKKELISSRNFLDVIQSQHKFDEQYLEALNAAIERISTIRAKEKRENAVTTNSYGSKIKKIESEIANLDSWQNKAAIEAPDGPQRIRGLAGSGKTIVLALKAAYLHAQNPSWNIVLTFHTQALYSQFEKLIQRFYYDDCKEDPDFDKLRIMHSFGSAAKAGLYYEICKAYNATPRDFGYAKRTYGYSNAFQGVCAELLSIVKSSPKALFDAILIDEAQDLPREFLQLAYYTTKDHRVVWAYDDLQNLSDYQLGSVIDIFGRNEAGEPLVDLRSDEKQPKKDIILPVCYRNTPWALVTGHALGAGLYRKKASPNEQPLIQHPDDPDLWRDIGYEVVDGQLEPSKPVTLKRAESSIPHFFRELLTPEDAVQFFLFTDDRQQLAHVADSIYHNIHHDELFPHDILVIFPNAIDAAKRGTVFSQFLRDRGIRAHVAGADYSRDVFIVKNSVAISGPYRAKGNEAPMVYAMDSHYCSSGIGLVKKRNTLFTAITRSRAWIRVCGVGQDMQSLIDEYTKLRENNFKLQFKVPTQDELAQMRTQHRDVTPSEEKDIEVFKQATKSIVNKGLDIAAVVNSLPPEVRAQLLKSLQQSTDDDDTF